MSDYLTKPNRFELEFSVFGTGYGESILTHLGENKWIIIDSCINPETKKPIPLSYLKDLDIDPSRSVELVVATHWHDDHVKGLSAILKACKSADFVCSDALKKDEFAKLVQAYQKSIMVESSGIDEFVKILEILRSRNQKKYPIFAKEGCLLWKSNIGVNELPISCRVDALSPSDLAVLSSKLTFSKLFPKHGEPKRALVPSGPNHAAVVIWTSVGDFNVLFGSDLQETSNPNTGWSVIVSSNRRPDGKAFFFKIPHHGSENGYHQAVWDEMVDIDCVGVLTAFNLGGVSLPTKTEISRLQAHTQHLYSTSTPEKIVRKRRDRTVERTIKEVVRSLKEINPHQGQVRYRTEDLINWEIDLFGEAIRLN